MDDKVSASIDERKALNAALLRCLPKIIYQLEEETVTDKEGDRYFGARSKLEKKQDLSALEGFPLNKVEGYYIKLKGDRIAQAYSPSAIPGAWMKAIDAFSEKVVRLTHSGSSSHDNAFAYLSDTMQQDQHDEIKMLSQYGWNICHINFDFLAQYPVMSQIMVRPESHFFRMAEDEVIEVRVYDGTENGISGDDKTAFKAITLRACLGNKDVNRALKSLAVAKALEYYKLSRDVVVSMNTLPQGIIHCSLYFQYLMQTLPFRIFVGIIPPNQVLSYSERIRYEDKRNPVLEGADEPFYGILKIFSGYFFKIYMNGVAEKLDKELPYGVSALMNIYKKNYLSYIRFDELKDKIGKFDFYWLMAGISVLITNSALLMGVPVLLSLSIGVVALLLLLKFSERIILIGNAILDIAVTELGLFFNSMLIPLAIGLQAVLFPFIATRFFLCKKMISHALNSKYRIIALVFDWGLALSEFVYLWALGVSILAHLNVFYAFCHIAIAAYVPYRAYNVFNEAANNRVASVNFKNYLSFHNLPSLPSLPRRLSSTIIEFATSFNRNSMDS